MVPRFVAILFEPRSADDAETANALICATALQAGWTRRFESDGLVVFDNGPAASAQIHLLPDAGGVVYGSLFPAQDRPPVAQILRAQTHAALSQRAASMVRDCWGRYVALFNDRTSFPAILRDPSGRSACHILRLSGTVRIAFTDIEDILPVAKPHLAIDWTYIHRFLTEHLASTRMTAIRNVTELGPGESFTLEAGKDSYSLVWDPASFAHDRIDDFEDASRATRTAAQFCVDRWTEQYRRIVLSLSGGLDSSVLAGLLKHSPAAQQVLCRNLCSDFVEADERHFARLVADLNGFELVIGKHGAAAMDFAEALQNAPMTLNPSRAFTTVAAVKDRQQVLDGIGADSFWSGFGGDQLFAAERNIAMARDYVLDRRIPFRLLQVARDVAEITGKSIATVLRTAVSSEDGRRSTYALAAPTFFADDLKGRPAENEHPIAQDCRAPAKAGHVLSVAMSLAANPFEKIADRPVIDLYASQPLMETCFRVPVYIHNQGGIRRSLQRHAFADLLPEAIRTRRGKGSAAADVVDSLLSPRNTRFIRSKIERGVLAQRGLLDPVRTKAVVAFERVPSQPDLNALISCIAVEDWAAKWQRALGR
ncbi:MAG: putative asparagine synthase [Rhodospirillales bacterium]|nr:putative asparagine synthase [Rhodospirillales bacterium]